jgi:hypothetical protein
MADYYPVLVRAVSRLPNNNARARKELYERARAIAIEELRRQGKSAPEITREQDALETAIRRVEVESPSVEAPMVRSQTPAQAPGIRDPVAEAVAPAKPAGTFLARIFRRRRPNKPRQRKPEAPALPARPADIVASTKRIPGTTEELGGMLDSLGTMLFGTAFIAAAMAFTGVVYIHGLVWVSEAVIDYPTLLFVTAIVFCLMIVLPLAVFRQTLSAFGFLSRLIHATSRRVF